MVESPHLSRAKNEAPNALLKIGMVILVLDEALKPSTLLVKAWVTLNIVKLR